MFAFGYFSTSQARTRTTHKDQKDSLQPHWKDPYQVLLTNPYAAKFQGTDFWIPGSHINTKPWRDLHTIWWPENKDFQEMKQMAAEGNSFPKMMGPDTYTFFPLVVLTFFALSRNENALMSTFPNPLQKGVTFLTAGSVTRSSNLFTMSEIPWCYLKRISF